MQEQIESLLNMITELKGEIAALQDRISTLEHQVQPVDESSYQCHSDVRYSDDPTYGQFSL